MPWSVDQIWAVLVDVAAYAAWYPRSLNLKVLGVTTTGPGSEVEICPRGGRAFRCRLESLEAPQRIRFRYPGNFIVGTGEWKLEAVPGGTNVTYEMQVAAHGWLVVFLGKMLPLGRLHSQSMGEVLEHLERETARRART